MATDFEQLDFLCTHDRLKPEVVDQTLGVGCLDCDTLLCWCRTENHVPESVWNRACKNDTTARLCEQNRDDHCAICGHACTLEGVAV